MLVIAVCAAAFGAVMLISSGRASYRVAAIFDTADGIIPGNQVKIAGVAVGSVDQVALAPGPKARIVMSLASGQGPFHRDATCTVLPEGLISENFVQCNPGSADGRPLARGAEGVPTVTLAHTTVPASLQQVLDVFSLPVDDRLRVMIDELGIATAGRGDDLNALLKRSNPALIQAQRVLTIIGAQRQQLATGISQTDRVLAALANQKQSVRSFVDRAAVVARASATHRTALGLSIKRLPALLDAARPGLRSLDTAINHGTPLLESLRSAAPELTTATYDVRSFVGAGIPALKSLGSATGIAQAAVHAASPVVADLESTSGKAVPFALDLDRLLVSTRDTGGLDGLLSLFYALAGFTSSYDTISHLAAGIIDPAPQCLENSGLPGCSYKYSALGNGTIPTDDPACGPRSGALWDPPTNCQSTAVSLARHGARNVRPSRKGTRATKAVSKSAAPLAPVTASTPALGHAQAPSRVNVLQPLLNFLLGR